MMAKLLPLLSLLALILLTGCHEPGHVDEWGAPPPATEKKAKQQGCAPSVAWVVPGYGTVTDVKVCPGLFGTEVQYIFIDSGPRQVWLSDPGRSCRVGDEWREKAGC